MLENLEAYIAVVNKHKIDTTLSLLDEDFSLCFIDHNHEISKAGMRNILGWDKGVNGRVSFVNPQVVGRSITALFTETNDFLQLIGIPELKATNTYEFNAAGLISKQVYTALPDQPSFMVHLQGAVDWARAHHPETLKEIYLDDRLVFNEEMGCRWVDLLLLWKQDVS